MVTDLSLTGSVRGLYLFDVAESIDLGRLRDLLGTRPARREPAFRHAAPEYVRFEVAPVTQMLGPRVLEGRSEVEARIRYFDYGVASVELLQRFRLDWDEVTDLATNWITSPDSERWAKAQLVEALKQTSGALQKPNENWLSEDYCVIHIEPLCDPTGRLITGAELIKHCGPRIAQIVRGDLTPLSASEREEVLRASLSYYESDILVVGWVAAFIYDTEEGAAPTIELLEYANSQLLEFRYYDEVLTRLLAIVYKSLERSHGAWRRWKAAREAQQLNTIRLDYQELVERTDNAIKFLSDMFYARMYKLAAKRIGVSDYLSLVNEKLNTARDLYDSMVNEFHQGRAFFLELLVVIILVVEIVFLFLGKTV